MGNTAAKKLLQRRTHVSHKHKVFGEFKIQHPTISFDFEPPIIASQPILDTVAVFASYFDVHNVHDAIGAAVETIKRLNELEHLNVLLLNFPQELDSLYCDKTRLCEVHLSASCNIESGNLNIALPRSFKYHREGELFGLIYKSETVADRRETYFEFDYLPCDTFFASARMNCDAPWLPMQFISNPSSSASSPTCHPIANKPLVSNSNDKVSLKQRRLSSALFKQQNKQQLVLHANGASQVFNIRRAIFYDIIRMLVPQAHETMLRLIQYKRSDKQQQKQEKQRHEALMRIELKPFDQSFELLAPECFITINGVMFTDVSIIGNEVFASSDRMELQFLLDPNAEKHTSETFNMVGPEEEDDEDQEADKQEQEQDSNTKVEQKSEATAEDGEASLASDYSEKDYTDESSMTELTKPNGPQKAQQRYEITIVATEAPFKLVELILGKQFFEHVVVFNEEKSLYSFTVHLTKEQRLHSKTNNDEQQQQQQQQHKNEDNKSEGEEKHKDDFAWVISSTAYVANEPIHDAISRTTNFESITAFEAKSQMKQLVVKNNKNGKSAATNSTTTTINFPVLLDFYCSLQERTIALHTSNNFNHTSTNYAVHFGNSTNRSGKSSPIIYKYYTNYKDTSTTYNYFYGPSLDDTMERSFGQVTKMFHINVLGLNEFAHSHYSSLCMNEDYSFELTGVMDESSSHRVVMKINCLTKQGTLTVYDTGAVKHFLLHDY